MENKHVIVIGGGLAGSEAAYQIAKRGIPVTLYEMRPQVMTPAHKGGELAEIVCSNSLGSLDIDTSGGLLKSELQRLGSFLLEKAVDARVPAGHALAVDRKKFSQSVTEGLSKMENLKVDREEIKKIPQEASVILASGPLTSGDLAIDVMRLTERKNLFFYDATAPIVEASSIDRSVVFSASRYDRGEGDDYLNAPFTKEEYLRFYNALIRAERVPLNEAEDPTFFEECLPIEEIASRGERTLAFGPLKPVGLIDPRTGERPFAVVQLRQDDLLAENYQLVGFQTRLTWSAQKEIFRLIPGLENASFTRFGVMHRNTFVNAPLVLERTFQTKKRNSLFIVGQLSGLEGYTEAIASGLLAGLMAVRALLGQPLAVPPPTTALGSLAWAISRADFRRFQPVKFSFGLLDPLEQRVKEKRERRKALAERATQDLETWIQRYSIL